MVRFGIVTAYEREDACSQGLLEACARLGEAVAIRPAELWGEAGDEGARVRLRGDGLEAISCFLLVRGLDPGGDPDVQFELYRALELCGRPVISRLDALLAAQDKFRTSLLLARAGVATPRAFVVQREDDLGRALEALGTAVAKPLWGSLGEGVEQLGDDRAGRDRGRQLLADRGAIYLQRFVEHGGRDVRAFVVGGVVEAAVERRAPPGEFRTNVARGGAPRAVELGPAARELAVRAAAALGLDWAGVDLVETARGPTVLEVNGTPSWEAVERATGRDMAVPIAHLARRRALTC